MSKQAQRPSSSPPSTTSPKPPTSAVDPRIEIVETTKKHFIVHDPSKNLAIKAIRSKRPLVKDIRNLENELKTSKTICHPGIRSSLERAVFEGREALVSIWINGHPLSKVKNLTMMQFFTIAREIVSSLSAMHMKHFMHMNLTLEHIIINSKLNCIHIIGCGSSVTFDHKNSYISNPELSEIDLRCISPEQTGRMNRDVDYRSDLYSIGVILYRLLTGRYPFESDNTFKLLHLHIFQDPVPVCVINPSIPVIVWDMISKLLRKDADERYYSCKGVIYDIDSMISEYENDKNLSSITSLAQHDIPEIFLISQKLYNRSSSYDTLNSRICTLFKEHSLELVFVSGDSGTGKSSIVYELYKVIAKQNGMFIRGKFDISKIEPFSAILEALTHLCEDILLQDETTIAKYKYQIQNAIGDEGRLTDVINNLHLIIGEQTNISDAFGTEAKNLFANSIIKFIQAVCAVGPPIILMLDDLQWLDLESLNILTALFKDKLTKNLMFICTYRQDEARKSNSVESLISVGHGLNINTTKINLENLDHETVRELISDTLNLSYHETYALATMMHKKTKGNPYFVKQMLMYLYEKKNIFYCGVEFKWKLNSFILNEIENITENVLELFRHKILSLSEYGQQALKIASCLGNSFSLSTIKLIINSSQGIEAALSSGMIVQFKGSETTYCFAADQIKQAAFSLLPTDSKAIFLHVGKKLWTSLPRDKLSDNIFTIAGLLHHVIDIISDKMERANVAKIFLEAGTKSLTSTAFDQAFKYLDTGLNLLDQDCWKLYYKLSQSLHDNLATASYCIANYSKMNLVIDSILKHTTSTLELVPSYSLKIKYYNDTKNYDDAISTALNILDQLGEYINIDQSDSMTATEITKAKSLFKSIYHGRSSDLLPMEDKLLLSVMMILGNMLHSCFFFKPELLCLASLRMVQITLRHGISKYAPFGFCTFGSYLVGARDDNEGYLFGQTAVQLLKKIKSQEILAWVKLSYYGTINPFFISIHDSFEPLLQVCSISITIGLHEVNYLAASIYVWYAFLVGIPLSDLKNEIDDIKQIVPMTKPVICIDLAVKNLLDKKARNPAKLIGEGFDFKSCFDTNENIINKSRCSLICCILAYIFYEYELALQFIECCRRNSKNFRMLYIYPCFLFYDGLVLLELANATSTQELKRKEYVRIAKENLLNLRKLSKNSPHNYLNKVLLLEAELELVQGNTQEATSCFRQAIGLSNKHGFLLEQALALERTGILFLKINSPESALDSLSKCYSYYKKWGSEAKMKHLTDSYPALAQNLQTSSSIDMELNLEDRSLATVSILTFSSTMSSFSAQKRKAPYE